uniref:Uncharacterized protein n=1 Tax=Siphoviridae sp. ctg2r17 TaxID=2825601 RepID=A0A8S5P1I7_9CAUD|nr:MAG TPA: hypothetical protein [Siphoviridae sp. ctg2r17]
MSSGRLCGRQSTSFRYRLLTCCGRRGLLKTSAVVGLYYNINMLLTLKRIIIRLYKEYRYIFYGK